MNVRQTALRAALLWGSLATLTVSGVACCCLRGGGGAGSGGKGCNDVDPGALPADRGADVREFQFRQAAKAEADDFVIYQYEWTMETAELGPFGRRHVAAASRRMVADAPFNFLIEASEDPKLDESRFLALTDILGQVGIADPASRVRIGVPAAEGLFGDEAQRVYPRIISGSGFGGQGGAGGFGGGTGFGQGGSPFGGFGGGGGGFGGGGFGGGGFGGGGNILR